MNHIVIQLLLSIPLGAAILRLLGAARSHRIHRRQAVGWLALWTMGLVVVWSPDLTIRLARMLGVARGVDAVLYLSVALLSYLVFRLYAALEKQDQVMTRLVSELVLRMPSEEQQSQPAAGTTTGPEKATGN